MNAARAAAISARTKLSPISLKDTADRKLVSSVLIIASSSRGGSSLLFQMLRDTGYFACLDGEHAHLYKMYGLEMPHGPGMHDGLDSAPTEECADSFGRELIGDMSMGGAVRPVCPDGFADQFVRRLAGQWHTNLPAVDEVKRLVTRLIERSCLGDEFDHETLLLDAIRALRDGGAEVDPWYYDIAPAKVRRHFPDLPRRLEPPVATIIEEPPFVVPRPAIPLSDEDLATRPVLLKASVDAYRLRTVAGLFPNAEVRVVHLVRNPAATVNGLMDGWLSNNFFSHRLPAAPLEITGYSHQPWGTEWWNFDLPPGWESRSTASLVQVCAMQWTMAHRSILAELTNGDIDSIRIRAERLMASPAERRSALREILTAVGLGQKELPDTTPPVVMATEAPRPARWRSRAAELGPAVDSADVRALTAALGLGHVGDGGWT